MADRDRDSGGRRASLLAIERPLGPDGIVVGAGAIDRPSASSRGVLLIHGFGDTPQTLAYLAEALHARGWGVRVPLLPGHGRPLEAFARSRANEWIAAVREELQHLQQRYAHVALVGLSMGGALASIVAADTPRLTSLTLIAPYVGMPFGLRVVAHLHPLVSLIRPVASGPNPRSIHNAQERAKSLATGAATPRLVAELWQVVRQASEALPRITVPTMLVQSRADNRIAPAVAERAFARLGASDKKLLWTTQGGHVITVDDGREYVLRVVGEWIDAHSPPRVVA